MYGVDNSPEIGWQIHFQIFVSLSPALQFLAGWSQLNYAPPKWGMRALANPVDLLDAEAE
jgi:hypothetical protein